DEERGESAPALWRPEGSLATSRGASLRARWGRPDEEPASESPGALVSARRGTRRGGAGLVAPGGLARRVTQGSAPALWRPEGSLAGSRGGEQGGHRWSAPVLVDHRGGGAQQDLDVLPEAPALDVEVVEAGAVLDGGVSAQPVDLGEPGEADG